MTLKFELLAEALCKVHGEIEAELRDEANGADPKEARWIILKFRYQVLQQNGENTKT